jgi:hypothetical protein
LGPELERRCPILWHAVEVSASIAPEDAVVVRDATRGRPLLIARDEGSRDRLRSAGIGPGIEVGPDPAVLASRVFAPALLRRRLAWLRFMGWYPVEGEAVVLQGAAGDVGSAARIATAAARVVEDRPGSSLVLLPTGPGDGDFAEAVAQEVPEAVRLPDEIGVEDIVAALAACSVFVGTSYHAHLVAMAYRRPQIVLPVSERPALAELADLLGQRFLDVEAGLVKTVQRAEEAAASPAGPRARLRAAADGHLDRIAAIALESDGRRPARGPGRVARPVDPSAARARQVQARRLALARSSLADRDAERRRALIAPVLHAEWRVRKALRLPYRVLRGWVRR